jgi:hypothetical protein
MINKAQDFFYWRKKNIIIEVLKFIIERNGTYKKVELKEFLLKEFREKENFEDRKEMNNFLRFLKKSEYILYFDENGISIVIEAGRPIPRNEISVNAKITSKGYEVFREYNISIINNAGIISSIIFGGLSFIFAFFGVSSNYYNNKLEDKIDLLRNENYKLKIEIIKEKID